MSQRHACTLTRAIAGSPSEVYEAFTCAEILARWFAPSYEVTLSVECAAIPGGAYRVQMHDQDGNTHPVCGSYKTTNPPYSLAFTWQWEAEAFADIGETLVSVEIDEEEGGSRVTVKHEGFPSEEVARQHHAGWMGTLGRLAHLFAPPSTKHVATTLALHRLLYHNALRGVSEQDLTRRPNRHTNHLLWIAGHVAHKRAAMAQCLGQHVQSPLEVFDAVISDTAVYPSSGEVKGFFGAASYAIFIGLNAITPEGLAKPASTDMPINDATIAGKLDFLLDHEAYHIGQMAFVRKFLGYKAMSYRPGATV